MVRRGTTNSLQLMHVQGPSRPGFVVLENAANFRQFSALWAPEQCWCPTSAIRRGARREQLRDGGGRLGAGRCRTM